MANVTQEQVKAFLDGMTIRELATMVDELEERWGVKAATATPVIVDPSPTVTKPKVKTEFDVVLVASGGRRIPVIRKLRELLGLSLSDARDLASETPVALREGIPRAEADALEEALTAEGATVEVR
ncbi:MAG: 50S ribosomal protein L7/L12 [Myxococcota bacterium]